VESPRDDADVPGQALARICLAMRESSHPVWMRSALDAPSCTTPSSAQNQQVLTSISHPGTLPVGTSCNTNPEQAHHIVASPTLSGYTTYSTGSVTP